MKLSTNNTLAIGTTSILRVSKQVNHEASAFVSRSAFLRVNERQALHPRTAHTPHYLARIDISCIKNLTITADSSRLKDAPVTGLCYWGALGPFATAYSLLETVDVTLIDMPEPTENIVRVLRSLAMLNCEQLLITAISSHPEEYGPALWYGQAPRTLYEYARFALRHNGGPGSWHGECGKGDEYLEFHPCAYRKKLDPNINLSELDDHTCFAFELECLLKRPQDLSGGNSN